MQAPPPRLLLSSAVLVGANLVPLFGVALGWWSTFEVMLLFWAENVVIGVMQLRRLGALAVLRGEATAVLTAAFFTVHYGLFTFVHGIFVMTLFGPAGPDLPGAWDGAEILLSPAGLLPALGALAASHLLSFAVNFLHGGEYRTATPHGLMTQPYQRVIVLHLVVLFGGFFVSGMQEPLGGLLLLVGLKIAFDLRAHLQEHRGAAAAEPG